MDREHEHEREHEAQAAWALAALLAGLSPVDWRAATPGHGSVRALNAHLTANDRMVAAGLGPPAVGVFRGTRGTATWGVEGTVA